MGVRISWLTLARNSSLARLAASAASLPPQVLFGALPLGDVEHEQHVLRPGSLDRRPGHQHRHAAPVLAEVLLLEECAGARRSELCHSPFGGAHPFRGRQIGPAQPARRKVVPRVPDHREKCVVGLDDPAVQVRDQHADDIGIHQAADLRLPLLEFAVEAAVLERHRRLGREHVSTPRSARV